MTTNSHAQDLRGRLFYDGTGESLKNIAATAGGTMIDLSNRDEPLFLDPFRAEPIQPPLADGTSVTGRRGGGYREG